MPFILRATVAQANDGDCKVVKAARIEYCTPGKFEALCATPLEDDIFGLYLAEMRPEPNFVQLKKLIADAITCGILSETLACLNTFAPGVMTSYALYNTEHPFPNPKSVYEMCQFLRWVSPDLANDEDASWQQVKRKAEHREQVLRMRAMGGVCHPAAP